MTFDHRDKKDLVCLSASRNLWTPGHTTESFNISVSELQLTFLCQKNYTWTEFLFPATDTVSLKNVEIWASCDLINSRTKIIQYKLNSGSLRDFWSICPWGKVHSADDDEVLSSVVHRFRDLLAKKKKLKNWLAKGMSSYQDDSKILFSYLIKQHQASCWNLTFQQNLNLFFFQLQSFSLIDVNFCLVG